MDGSFRHETLFTAELLPHMDAHFRTQASREGRILERFSIGGQGVARLGLKQRRLFGAMSLVGACPPSAGLH